MRDAKGYGTENEPRDAHGRWTSGGGGAADGDPSKENATTRQVPGHGKVPRSQVVARHNNTPSVGTSMTDEEKTAAKLETPLSRLNSKDRAVIQKHGVGDMYPADAARVLRQRSIRQRQGNSTIH